MFTLSANILAHVLFNFELESQDEKPCVDHYAHTCSSKGISESWSVFNIYSVAKVRYQQD